MAYEPTVWNSGDVVTSAKLNNIEQGIANAGAMIVHATETDTAAVLDHTWQEIADADFAVIIADSPIGNVFEPVLQIGGYGESYFVKVLNGMAELVTDTFIASSADGYPSHTFE